MHTSLVSVSELYDLDQWCSVNWKSVETKAFCSYIMMKQIIFLDLLETTTYKLYQLDIHHFSQKENT